VNVFGHSSCGGACARIDGCSRLQTSGAAGKRVGRLAWKLNLFAMSKLSWRSAVTYRRMGEVLRAKKLRHRCANAQAKAPLNRSRAYSIRRRSDRSMSAVTQRPDILHSVRHVCFVPILLQKSFGITECKFSGPHARRSNNHLRDYIIQRRTHRRLR